MKQWGRWQLRANFPKLEEAGAMKRILKSAIHYLGYEIQALPRPSRYTLFEEPDDRDYEQLRSFAARAARFSASVQQANAIRSLYHTGLLTDQSQTSYSRFEIGDENTLSLGVWRRESPGKQMPFIRDPRKDHEWFYWAKQERIEPKRTRWRVVLLGNRLRGATFTIRISTLQVCSRRSSNPCWDRRRSMWSIWPGQS